MELNKDNETSKPTSGAANGVSEEAPEPRQPAGEVVAAADYEKLLAEKKEYYDLALRKQAELENFRKRTQREKEEFLQQANADLMRSLLPALDGFDRALRRRDPSVPAQFYEGFELIRRELLDTLARAGLTTVKAEGETFDPNLHQAVETLESARHRDHEIVEELQRGYKLRQKLLRPAVVKVAVRPEKAATIPDKVREDG
ncbi:MAG: nucleotide exchange factor GrpE [Acidobacteriota bacterium]|nr:nucleotide exchange factor GrpE [Acidobacteriota bacterium]